MNERLLLILADALERPLPKLFSLLPAWDCSTTACAVGHAATLPEFYEAGLRMVGGLCTVGLCPEYEGLTGFSAVEKLFGLNTENTDYLFHYDEYPYADCRNPLAVAARIRAFVAEHQEES